MTRNLYRFRSDVEYDSKTGIPRKIVKLSVTFPNGQWFFACAETKKEAARKMVELLRSSMHSAILGIEYLKKKELGP